MKQKGSGEGWGINSSFKQYLLKKGLAGDLHWTYWCVMVLCYANKNNQHLQGFSHSPSRAERQTALRKESNTNTGWSTHAHLFPGTATASVRNRNTESKASTAQFQHTTPALPAAPAKWEVRSRTEASLTESYHSGMAKRSIKTHSIPILVLHHLLIQCVLWHSWKCHWKYLERWVLAKKSPNLLHKSWTLSLQLTLLS